MPAAIIASAVIGGGMSMAGSSKAARSQKEAMEAQQKSAQQDLAFRQKMYEDAQAKYGPLEQQMLGQATSNQPLGYEMLSGQIQQQYADALRRIGQQGMGGMGGGLQGGAARQAQFGLATGLGGAYAQGQMNRLNLGQSLLGRDPSAQLGMNVSGGMQNMTNLYGNTADMYGKLAGAGAQGLGNAINSGLNAYGQYQMMNNMMNMYNSGGNGLGGYTLNQNSSPYFGGNDVMGNMYGQGDLGTFTGSETPFVGMGG